MVRELNEKEIQYLDSGFRLLKDNIIVRYEKYPNANGFYKVWCVGDDIEKEHSWNYATQSIQELKGMFDGYFKGLNKVFGDKRNV